jgi:hypothetical protein
MVIALLALAVAMIAGGGVAVVQGYDIVLLERGWTLVISGSVCATGGAILLGLTMVLTRLGRIQAELVTTRDRMSEAEPAFPPSSALDPLAAVSTGLLAGGTGVTSSRTPGESDAQEATLPLFMRRNHEEANESAADAASDRDEGPGNQGPAAAANLPDANRPEAPARNDNRGPRLNLPQYLFGGRKAGRDKPETRESEATHLDAPVDPDEVDFDLGRIGPESERGSQPERTSGLVFPAVGADNRGDERRGDERRDERRDERNGLDRTPGDEPLEDERDDAAASDADDSGDTGPTQENERNVVGTYNSGDNRYVMFSDGSIEAETPEGLFRFGSLDELKDFIASGGERRSGSTPSS